MLDAIRHTYFHALVVYAMFYYCAPRYELARHVSAETYMRSVRAAVLWRDDEARWRAPAQHTRGVLRKRYARYIVDAACR